MPRIERSTGSTDTAHIYESYMLVGEVVASIGEIERAVADLSLRSTSDLMPPELRNALDEIK